jgi:hypothetical protein
MASVPDMKKHMIRVILIVALLFPAGALLLSWEGNIFPHKPHIDGGIECAQCHRKIKESVTTTAGPDLPDRKICNDCHDEGGGYSKKVKYRYRQSYKFNHKLHVAGQGIDCKECHGALYQKDIVEQKEIVPKMEYCYQCHDNTTATRYCALCHLDPVKPDDHTGEWDKLHGKKASADKKQCLSCHTKKDSCLRCHKGDKAAYRYHSPNFGLSHKYESRLSLKHCRSCHSERQCRDCHKSSGVNYKYPPLAKRHPAGWENRFSSSFHGRQARRNIASCTTCHTKNQCNYCHFWFKRD